MFCVQVLIYKDDIQNKYADDNTNNFVPRPVVQATYRGQMLEKSFCKRCLRLLWGWFSFVLLFLFSQIQHVANQQKQRIKNGKTKDDNSNRWLRLFSSLTNKQSQIHYAEAVEV